eukprot:5085308-Amphidinium_carterae.1
MIWKRNRFTRSSRTERANIQSWSLQSLTTCSASNIGRHIVAVAKLSMTLVNPNARAKSLSSKAARVLMMQGQMTELETMIDLGCQFFAKAFVPDTSRIAHATRGKRYSTLIQNKQAGKQTSLETTRKESSVNGSASVRRDVNSMVLSISKAVCECWPWLSPRDAVHRGACVPGSEGALGTQLLWSRSCPPQLIPHVYAVHMCVQAALAPKISSCKTRIARVKADIHE